MVSPILKLNRSMDNLRGYYPQDIIEARGAVGRSTPAEYRNLMPLGSDIE